MQVRRGVASNTTTGDRTIIYCEGGGESSDIIFYKTLLGANVIKFDFEPLGSSNTLLCYAETNLIDNGFCLIDRDFRRDSEVSQLEEKYKIKFLPRHEIENFLLDSSYLKRLEYCRNDINIEEIIDNVISSKRVRFLADFLQFRINTHLDRFPRIPKLKNHELPSENELVDVLLFNLNNNYKEVIDKVKEIKEEYIEKWREEFYELERKYLPGKDIFKILKSQIFNNPPPESDIIKDIATLMEKDGFIPSELQYIFNIQS